MRSVAFRIGEASQRTRASAIVSRLARVLTINIRKQLMTADGDFRTTVGSVRSTVEFEVYVSILVLIERDQRPCFLPFMVCVCGGGESFQNSND